MSLYLEDVVVGSEFTSGEVMVTAPEIIAFASQFDPQPFHLDPVVARDTFFGGLAASGWHTAAITMRLRVTGCTSTSRSNPSSRRSPTRPAEARSSGSRR
jgi:acyl dehydratase